MTTNPPLVTSPNEPLPPSSDPRRDIYAIIRAFVFLGFIAFLLWLAGDVLLLLFAGVLVAIFIGGIAGWIRTHTKMSRGLSIAITLVALTLLVGGIGVISAPDISEQFAQLSDALPRAVDNLHLQLGKSRWGKSIMDQLPSANEIRSPGVGLVRKATGALSSTFIVITRIIVIGFIGVFLTIQPELYRRGFLRLVPIRRRMRAADVMDQVGANLRGWLVGKVLSAIVIGVATWTGLQLLGIPLSLILAVLAAVLSFIPNFGPILAVIPAMLLGLMQSIHMALYVFAVYTGIQILETYLLTPWLAHRTANLPPALTLLTQILLGVLFGGMGVILAAPLTAVGMVLVRTLYVEDVLGDRGDTVVPAAAPSGPA
ncbi:MAG TPA: AI-2E family transporter [Candidatus Eisenbacteria bacterium]|jgi:predicted PurR-regulated permease PerM|nr:AI-2E family transporter [Candidatus Eisenbacteria bacterium]